MIELSVTKFDIAKLFGLEFVSWDFKDTVSCEAIYIYRMQGKEFTRSDEGYRSEDQMHRVVAEEILEAIGKVAAVEIK